MVRFPALDGIACYAVGRGDCWLGLDGHGDPMLLAKNDCVLLASGRAFTIAARAEDVTADVATLSPFTGDGIHKVDSGGHALLMGGHLSFEQAHRQLLSSVLPPMVLVHDYKRNESLSWALGGMWRELAEPRPGSGLILQQLTRIILVFMLQIYLERADAPPSWLSALADPRIAAALGAIHAEPGRPWTVQSIAARAGMSRSAFANRFRTVVGIGPMAYLIRWRLNRAAALLRDGGKVQHAAHDAGYRSESAFSFAFRKQFGLPPRTYARGTAAQGTGSDGDGSS